MKLDQMPQMAAKLEKLRKQEITSELFVPIGSAVLAVVMLIAAIVKRNNTTALLLLLLCAVVALVICYLTLKPFLANKKLMASTWEAFSDEEVQRMEEDVKNAELSNGTLFTRDAWVAGSDYGPLAVRIKDIVWIYADRLKDSTEDIVLKVCDRNNNTWQMLKSVGKDDEEFKKTLAGALQAVGAVKPGVKVGNTPDNVRLHDENFEKMVKKSDRTLEEVAYDQRPRIWELATDEGTLENPSDESILEALQAVFDEKVQNVFLTPPEDVGDITFIRIEHDEGSADLKVKAGRKQEDGSVKEEVLEAKDPTAALNLIHELMQKLLDD